MTTPELIQKIEKLISEDARLKKKQLTEIVGVSDTTIFKILHDHLGMTMIGARWVPRMLTLPQKQQRVKCSRAFLDLCKEDKDGVSSRIVTGDETWIYYYELESKQNFMHKKGTPPPKKFKVSQSAGKLMAMVFWDSEGILLIDYKDKGVSITGQYYALILERLKEAIKEKRRGKLIKGVLLIYNNAPVYKSCVALAALHKEGFDILNHPNLAPSDYYLFPKLKKNCVKRNLLAMKKDAILSFFRTKIKHFFMKVYIS